MFNLLYSCIYEHGKNRPSGDERQHKIAIQAAGLGACCHCVYGGDQSGDIANSN